MRTNETGKTGRGISRLLCLGYAACAVAMAGCSGGGGAGGTGESGSAVTETGSSTNGVPTKQMDITTNSAVGTNSGAASTPGGVESGSSSNTPSTNGATSGGS